MDFTSPGAWRSGGLWRAVPGCEAEVVVLLEDCILEAWSLETWSDDEAEDEDDDE